MAQRDLRRVRRQAEKLERAQAELRDAILQAHRSGESVRDIAPFAGMSPSRVHDLLKEARRLESEG
jgi:DNA-directed RNA polymerase specialized sigma24 family protein